MSCEAEMSIPSAALWRDASQSCCCLQELDLGEMDVIEVDMQDAHLVVHEPKVKVDLTKFTELHQFSFDTAMDESVTNDQVYAFTVQPLVATLFRGGKATCFAYGQVSFSPLWHV